MPTCLLFKAKLLFVWQRARKGVGTLSWADPRTECDLLQDADHVPQGTVLWESLALSSLVFQDLPATCVSWEANDELCKVQLLGVVNMSFGGGWLSSHHRRLLLSFRSFIVKLYVFVTAPLS